MKCKIWRSSRAGQILESGFTGIDRNMGLSGMSLWVCAPSPSCSPSKGLCSDSRGTGVSAGRSCQPCAFTGARARKGVNGTGAYKYDELVLHAE